MSKFEEFRKKYGLKDVASGKETSQQKPETVQPQSNFSQFLQRNGLTLKTLGPEWDRANHPIPTVKTGGTGYSAGAAFLTGAQNQVIGSDGPIKRPERPVPERDVQLHINAELGRPVNMLAQDTNAFYDSVAKTGWDETTYQSLRNRAEQLETLLNGRRTSYYGNDGANAMLDGISQTLKNIRGGHRVAQYKNVVIPKKLEEGQTAKTEAEALLLQIQEAEDALASTRNKQRLETVGQVADNAAAGISAALTGVSSAPKPYTSSYEGQIQNQETALADLRQQYSDKMYTHYSSYLYSPDFEEKSKYQSTKNGKPFHKEPNYNSDGFIVGYTIIEDGFDNLLYDYINKDPAAIRAQSEFDAGSNSWLVGLDKNFLQQMTDTEVKVYNYLYATQGGSVADEYVQFLTSDLNARQRLAEEQEMAKLANEHPILSSVGSVMTSPLKGISYAGQAIDYLTDGQIDQNAAYNRYVYGNSAIRDTVSKKIEDSGKWGKVGSFAYQTGMSMGDFLISTGISGGNSTISLAIMGTGSAADTTLQAKDRGLSDDQAFALGTVAGAAEVVMEKTSLDALFGGDMSEGAFKYILKNSLTEGTEEVGTDLINTMADILISQEKSQWQQTIAAYEAQGKSSAEAFGLAMADKAMELGVSFAGGALSGGVMGGGNYAISYKSADIGNISKEIEKLNPGKKTVQGYISKGLSNAADTQSHQIAQRLQQKLDSGEPITNKELAWLLQANKAADPTDTTVDQLLKSNAEAGITVDEIQSLIDKGLTAPEGTQYHNVAAELDHKMDSEALTVDDVVSLLEAVEQAPEAQTSAIDALSAAVATVKSSGTISNKQAEKILSDENAVSRLVEEAGLELPETMSGRRAAVKQAVAKLAESSANEALSENPTEMTGEVAERSFGDEVRRQIEESHGIYSNQSESVDTAADGGYDNGKTAPQTIGVAEQIRQEDNGGIENGQAGYANTGDAGVLSGGQGRRLGSSSGRPAGSMARGAGSPQTGVEQSATASGRQSAVNAQEIPAVSSASLGVENGSTKNTLRVMPVGLWDDAQKATAKRIYEKTGKRTTFVIGGLLVETPKGAILANGVWTDRGIIIRADHQRFIIDQIADHEIFHDMSFRTPWLVKRIEDEIRAKYGDEELQQVIDAYVEKLALVPENATPEQIEAAARKALEEILADAYAGVNRFGADAAQFHEDVQRGTAEDVRPVVQKQENGVRVTSGPPQERYSIDDVSGENGDYGIGVHLDTDIFDGVKPSAWGKILGEFVYNHLAGTEMTVYDENGAAETIYFAKANDRVRKDGAKNSHKVIDKLARYRGDNISALATVHLSEMLETSKYGASTDEHNHQWMDENGWEYRKTYIQDRNGNIYEATLNIANGRERRILYAISNIKQIDKERATRGVVPSTNSGRGSLTKGDSSADRIADDSDSVKEKYMMDGSPFDSSGKNEAEPTSGGGVVRSDSLATPISSASSGILPKDADIVNGEDRQIQSAPFKEWFGDWQNAPTEASKVVDADGRPMVMYHGTSNYGFTAFDTYGGKFGLFGKGSYFTNDSSVAESYTEKGKGSSKGVYPVYLNIRNPLDMDTAADIDAWRRAFEDAGLDQTYLDEAATNEDAFKALKENLQDDGYTRWEAEDLVTELIETMGFDGITHIGGGRYNQKDGTKHRVFIAFEPEQIKSATDNIGTFDGNNPDIRFMEDDTGGDALTEEQRQRLTELENVPEYRPGMRGESGNRSVVPDDEYIADVEKRAVKTKSDLMRNIPKKDFRGTDALEKLGIKIENSVGNYSMVKSMIANDRSVKDIIGEMRKAEKRLAATAGEKNYAAGIAAGYYKSSDIPSDMDADKVLELADYLWAAKAISSDLIQKRRTDIQRTLFHKMEQIMRKVDISKIHLPKAFTMHHRSAVRNMLTIFGPEIGAELNAFLFDPVATNEAERIRFINRMHDAVRKFKGKGGKAQKLNKRERALVQQVIEGRALEETVAGMEMRHAIKNAAHNIRNGTDAGDAAREFSLDSEGRKLAIQYSKWMQTQEALEGDNVDATRIDNAVKKYGELFDQFHDAINDSLVAHGYEPIGYIKGYAPHMQPEENQSALRKALEKLGLSPDVTTLPTSIAGLTKNFKPNKRWNPFFLSRRGDVTKYDIVTAFESYVDYMSDVIYHTDDIMRVRQATEWVRKTYAPEDNRNLIDQALELRYSTVDDKLAFLRENDQIGLISFPSEAEINKALDEYIDKLFGNLGDKTVYSNFVMWLDDYANKLAGKQLHADREQEKTMGRTSLNFVSKLNRWFTRAQVAGNFSSALNQTAQLPQVIGENGIWNTAMALKDMVFFRLRRTGWYQDSDFLTEKKGIHYIVNSPGEMVISATFKLLEIFDHAMSTLAVRGRYLKEIKAGKSHAEAMKAADRFGRNVMGSRAKGSVPLAFQQKGILSQFFHTFQVEAANSWEHLVVDLPQDFRQIQQEKGTSAATGALAGVILKTLITAFLLNRFSEELYGGTPAPYDLIGLTANFIASGQELSTNELLLTVMDNCWESITGERIFNTEDAESLHDGEFDWGAAIKDSGYNISNDIPYLRNAFSLLGWGDDTLPMPDIWGTGTDIYNAATNEGVFSPEMGQALLGLVGDVLPGGRQLEKTAAGIETAIRGGKYKGWGDNAKLQYPVDVDWKTAVRLALFGDAAASERNEFYASENSALTAKQTQLYESLVNGGADSKEVYESLQDYRKADNDETLSSAEQSKKCRDIIRNMDMSDELKLEMYRGLTDSESTSSMLQTLMEDGLDWNEVMDLYEKHLERFVLSETQFSVYETITGGGVDAKDTYEAIQQYRIVQNSDELTSLDRGKQSRDIIRNMDMSDELKLEMYRGLTGAESTADKFEDFMDNGLSWNNVMDIYDEYSEIEADSELEASEQATKFARWVDVQGFSSAQEKIIKEQLLYWNMYPARADSYEEFIDSGLEPDDAYKLSGNLSELEPVAGTDKVAYLQKWRECVDFSSNENIQLSALAAQMDDNQFANVQIAYDNYISPDTYITFREVLADVTGGGSATNEEAKIACNRMRGLDDEKKAILWQLGTGRTSAKNNPFSVEVGEDVLKAKQETKNADKES